MSHSPEGRGRSESVPPPGWALVVGGSGGIGRAICEALARDGRDLVLTFAGNAERAEETAAALRETGRDVRTRRLLLPDGDPGDLRGLRDLVFAAGADISQPYISRANPDDLRAAVDLELHGFFALAQRALPKLRTQRGSITAISSAGLNRFPPGDILSVAPKAAVQAVVRGLAREEGRYGVRANAVAVGVVEAGIFHRIEWEERWIEAAKRNIPLGRFGRAEEVADAVAFLVSERAAYVTGQTLFVDGGFAT